MFNSSLNYDDLSNVPNATSLATKPIDNCVVYLVEDDYDDRLFAYSKLRESDRVSEVRPVKCAETLFRCFENAGIYDSSYLVYNPALIVLDMHMPGMNGIETLAKIRRHPITADVPVILLTSDVSHKSICDAYKLKANGYLQKPLHIEQFHEMLDQGWGWILEAQK